MKVLLRHWKGYVVPLLILGSLLLVMTACAGKEKPTLVFADTQFESLWINNAVAQFVLEHGYGYPVESVETTTPIAQASLAKGDVDIWMEGWEQNFLEWYDEQIAEGTIENLGMTYEGGPQFWIIPKWMSEQYNIKTVSDMKDPAIAKLVQDPEDSSKGLFINCMTGWQCAEINNVKFGAYGLDEYYNIMTPGSFGAELAAMGGPQKKNEPVFGYFWAPTPLMGMYDWHILEEPAYNDECWKKVAAAQEDHSLRPIDEACAYETLPINKLVNGELRDNAPDIIPVLEKMVVGLDPLNVVAAWAEENEIQDWNEAGIYYLQNYEERWKSWVSDDAYKKIKKALEEAS
jgi:glycine betaine/proline transport system substrate-binding protein